MTHQEMCQKAVDAYRKANPSITVTRWEYDTEETGAAILHIGNRSVRIKYSPAEGYEMIRQIDTKPTASQASHQVGVQNALYDMPEFVPWTKLDESGTGALPVILDIMAYVILFGSIIGVIFSPVSLAVGLLLFAGLASAAAMTKSVRATSAKTAYIAETLHYIAKRK